MNLKKVTMELPTINEATAQLKCSQEQIEGDLNMCHSIEGGESESDSPEEPEALFLAKRHFIRTFSSNLPHFGSYPE